MANLDRVDKLKEQGVTPKEPPAFVTENERELVHYAAENIEVGCTRRALRSGQRKDRRRSQDR